MSVTETSQFAPAGTWTADPVHSAVSFEVAHTGVAAFRGGFRDFSVTLAGGETPVLEGTAAVASVDVADENLSAHLQAPDFFDAERHPAISFRSSELRRDADGRVEGSGELELKGVVRPIEVVGAVAVAPAVDPFGKERLGLRLEARIDRTDFGVSWNAPLPGGGDYLGDEVTVVAELNLVREAD